MFGASWDDIKQIENGYVWCLSKQVDRVKDISLPAKHPSNNSEYGSKLKLVDHTKTGKNKSKKEKTRYVVLGPKCMELLKNQYEYNNLQKNAAGNRWQENNLIFPSSIGTLKSYSNWRKQFIKFIDENNLPKDLTSHMLRHTMVSAMSHPSIDAPKSTQKKRSGHATDEALSRYTHISKEIDAVDLSVAKKLEDYLLDDKNIDNNHDDYPFLS